MLLHIDYFLLLYMLQCLTNKMSLEWEESIITMAIGVMFVQPIVTQNFVPSGHTLSFFLRS